MNAVTPTTPNWNRLRALTERVETKFGAVYCHCHFDELGRVHGISISYPGRHMEKEVGDALDAINKGLNGLIEAVMNAAK